MSAEILYRKKSNGRYEPVVNNEPEFVNSEFTPEQIVTMVGTMGICLIASIERLLPDHSRLGREISKVEQQILKLYQNTGQRIDNDTLEYMIDCWNETMRRISRGIPA